MNEKIMVRIAEVEAWGDLVRYLNRMAKDAKESLESAQQSLNEKYPDGGEDVKSSWQYDGIQKTKAKLTAYESIRATILKAMG